MEGESQIFPDKRVLPNFLHEILEGNPLLHSFTDRCFLAFRTLRCQGRTTGITLLATFFSPFSWLSVSCFQNKTTIQNMMIKKNQNHHKMFP